MILTHCNFTRHSIVWKQHNAVGMCFSVDVNCLWTAANNNNNNNNNKIISFKCWDKFRDLAKQCLILEGQCSLCLHSASIQNMLLIFSHPYNYVGSCQLEIWLSLWSQGINFTATRHQLFPVRDAGAGCCSVNWSYTECTNAFVAESIDLLSPCSVPA